MFSKTVSVAQAALTHRLFYGKLCGPRREALDKRGAMKQSLIWAFISQPTQILHMLIHLFVEADLNETKNWLELCVWF